uniref:Nicotinamide-nucleotide adenylyltransferase n=1 Tax=Oreochromis niloticus TaxID=8128 RepID=A0A669CXI1_ORENI
MAARRVPLVLLACGSFNPITNQHMRLFELARDHMHSTGQYQVVGGIVSPVSDSYGKQGLVLAKHRVAMAELALQSSNWVTVDEWESQQPDWTETVVTMRYHYGRILKEYERSVGMHNNSNPSPQLKLLCGADFLDTFKIPGLWRDDHVEELVGHFGLVCVSRGELQPERAVHESDLLSYHRHNIFHVREWVKNETSATEVRRALRRDVNIAIRKIATLLKPDKDIVHEGDHIIIKTLSTFKNYNMDFYVSQEFEEDLSGVDDRKCMTTITWEGDRLVCVQKGEIEGRGWTHWVEGDELHLELRAAGVVSKQVFKKT